jgi:capsular exopolysaccharide synthesis family protein
MSQPEKTMAEQQAAAAVPAVPVSKVTVIPAANMENPALRSFVRPGSPAVFTPTAIMRALRRRWLLSTTLAIVSITAAVGGAWFVLKPSATVQSLLQVASSQPRIILPTVDNLNTSREDYANYQKDQTALVKLPVVLNKALSEPKVANLSVLSDKPEPLDWLAYELKVDFSIGPGILRVAMDGDKPEELAVIVSAVADAYLKEIVNKERDDRLRRLDQVKKIQADKAEKLRTQRKEMRALADQLGSGDSQVIPLTHMFALQQLDTAKRELLLCRAEQKRIKAELEARKKSGLDKSSPPTTLPAEEVEAFADKDQPILEQQKKITLNEVKVTKVKESTRAAAEAKHQIEEARKRIEARKKEMADHWLKQWQARVRQQREMTSNQLVEKLGMLELLEKDQTADVNRLMTECKDINKGSLEFQALKDEIAQGDAMLKRISDEAAALEVEVQAPARVRPLQDANINRLNAEKKRYMGMALAGVGALAFSLFGVSFLELRARRIFTTDEVSQGLGMRVVGSVPYLLPPNGRNATADTSDLPAPYGERIFAESIDSTRTILLHAARQNSLRVVMITSAIGGEGKTFLASQLAASLAHAGRRTLLVDADLRKPSVHHVFDTPAEPGLSNLLARSVSLEAAIHSTSTDRLFVLPAGEVDEDVLRSLARGGAKPIFAQLRERFDIIIVDSSPVLPVADALLVGQEADAVVFSILREVSRMPAVQAAWGRLDAVGIRMLGAVVNGVSSDTHAYSRY